MTFSRALARELVRRRSKALYRATDLFITALGLDIRDKSEDRSLAMYHRCLFDQGLGILDKWANSERNFSFRDAAPLIELILRSRNAIRLYGGLDKNKTSPAFLLWWSLSGQIAKVYPTSTLGLFS